MDLDLFSAIQPLLHEACAALLADLVDIVHEAFDPLPHNTLTDTHTTLQAVLREILKTNSGNDFQLAHLKKQANRRKKTRDRAGVL